MRRLGIVLCLVLLIGFSLKFIELQSFMTLWKPKSQELSKLSIDELETQAQHGTPLAQMVLANRFQKGIGATKDFKKAVFWWTKAAEQGHPYAQYRLGSLYERGRGVPQDFGKAIGWYRASAEQGYAPAQNILGVRYRFGLLGLPKDSDKALYWIRKAVEQGFAPAKL